MSEGPLALGDQGQVYKIQFYADEPEHPLKKGWNNYAYTNILETAKAFAESAVLRPNWSRSRIFERKEGYSPRVIKSYKEAPNK